MPKQIKVVPSITVSPEELPVDEVLTVRGINFPPGAMVTLDIGGHPEGEIPVTPSGEFVHEVVYRWTEGNQGGSHNEARALLYNKKGEQEVVATAPFTVV